MPQKILAQHETSLTADTKLVIAHGNWRNREYVDVRVHWQAPSGEWFPTKRGVRVDTLIARALASTISDMVGQPLSEKPRKNGHKASNGHRKPDYGLPGPNPPRNAAGGFKVTGLGAIERSGPSGATGASIQDRTCPESPCGHRFPIPAVFIPQWVKYAIQFIQAGLPVTT